MSIRFSQLTALAALAAAFPAAAAVLTGSPEPAVYTSRLDGAGQEHVLDMVTDTSGNVYVAGSFSSEEMKLQVFKDAASGNGAAAEAANQTRTLRSAGGTDLFLAKYDPQGTLIWARSAGGAGNEAATGLALDPAGNIYVTGFFSASADIGGTVLNTSLPSISGAGAVTGPGAQSDLFVAMLSPSGVWRWAKRLDYKLFNQTTTFTDFLKVDFAPDEPTAGWQLDSGLAFGQRTNGMNYGWFNAANQASDNQGTDDDSEGLDENFIHTGGMRWRVEVPAGQYRISAKSGDPDFNDSYYHTVVATSGTQQATLIDRSGSAGNFASGSVTVTLQNAGWIELRDGQRADNNKLSWVRLETLTTQKVSQTISGPWGMRSGDDRHPGRALALFDDQGTISLYLKGRFIEEQNITGNPGNAGAASGIYFQPVNDSAFLLDNGGSISGARNGFVARLKMANVVAEKADPAAWQWDWFTPFGSGYTFPGEADNIIIADLTTDAQGDVIVGGAWRGRLSAGGSEVDTTNNTPAASNTEGFVMRLRKSDGGRALLATVRADTATDRNRAVHVEALTTDADGAVIATGNFNPGQPQATGTEPFSFVPAGSGAATLVTPGSAQNCFLAKVAAEGQWEWIEKPGGTALAQATGLSVDVAGSIYLSGVYHSGTLQFGGLAALAAPAVTASQPFLAKRTASGWSASTAESCVASAPVTATGVNAGGAAFGPASDGISYAADSGFSTGQTFTTSTAIASTTDDALYQSERYAASLSWSRTLPNGQYRVTLKFSENFFTAAGQRVFSVDVEGQRVLTDFDIFAAAGGRFVAVDRTFLVHVTDGTLSISATASTDNAKFSAISVESEPAAVHAAQIAAASNGRLWWMLARGGEPWLAAQEAGSQKIGNRTGTNAALDTVQSRGAVMVAANFNLTNGSPPANDTGYAAGQEIPAPVGAFRDGSGRPLQPDLVVEGRTPQEIARIFYWDAFAGKLYAVSPVEAAMIKWKVTDVLLDTARIEQQVATRWPNDADGPSAYQTHVIGAGDGTEPALDPNYGPDRTHRFSGILYSDAGGRIDGASLAVTSEGWSTLLFNAGLNPVPAGSAALVLPVKHVRWQSIVAAPVNAVIGTELTDASHQDPLKNGYVANELSRYDGAGENAAHRRASREGPVIPVNTDDPNDQDDDMVVIWYRKNAATGVLFPVKPVRYNCQWPAAPERIVITSSLGSDVAIPAPGGAIFPQEPLLPAKLRNTVIYHQPSRQLPGFNPNEEHALLAESQTRSGGAVYALRNDLNRSTVSDPYVLLKYQDATDSLRWKMKVYRVELTGTYTSGTDSVTFDFSSFRGTAGTQVQPPFPLSTLAARTETVGEGTPYWEDRNGVIWSRCAGQLTVGYWYPLQPGFWFDKDNDGQADAVQAVPWLEFVTTAQAPGNATVAADDPIRIHYTISWPGGIPKLAVGDTLSRARDGLPDLRNWISSEIIFDQNQPGIAHVDPAQRAAANPLLTSARLFDAMSPRTALLASSDSGGQLTNTGGKPLRIEFGPAGKKKLSDLPPHLKLRILFNPGAYSGQGGIEFFGYDPLDPTGASPVLINVMSSKERTELLALDDPDSGPTSNSQWDLCVNALYLASRNPNALAVSGQPADGLLYGLVPRPGASVPLTATKLDPEQVRGGAALTAGLGAGIGYMTLAQNNAPGIDSPVALSIIEVVNPPVRGNIHVINPDNVFDERVTLRHSGDFGGEAAALTFEWYYKEDSGGPAPTTLPTNDASWQLLGTGTALNGLTLSGSGIRSLADGWVYVRYKGYSAGGFNPATFTQFAGDRSATDTPRPAHIDGWVKRVVFGVNAFEQRVKDFHSSPAQTYVSMIQQAGRRYEGDVAFNPSADNLNSVGLIELYQTVLNRGLSLSLNGTPSQSTSGSNNALLLAASRIADFYMLLGNEAYADAQDPTIGFNAAGAPDFGTLASSVFAFQNQLPSLLDEELHLLRGRDDSAAGVGARPVYNRLFWNFTNGLEGEPAYVLNYGVSDQNTDGFINETDAATLYPQGHGDAWGHYLTATKTYYKLLRHPQFTWVPRSETVSVAGVAINVDFLDEVKFARAAAAKAKAGREIVDLNYRASYVEDPAGQWQGYKDTDSQRAWGVDEWARRAGQGAFLDWVAGNAILPTQSAKTGLEKIDRETVTELREVARQFQEMQASADKMDRGLNPLSLTGDSIPFDIEPSAVVPPFGGEPVTHFEQIFARAQKAVNNALDVFTFANSATERLRSIQVSADNFATQVADTDRDFKNRLIEIYGYPYEGDIGPGKVYPFGYDGPDLYKWMYVDVTEFSLQVVPQATTTATWYHRKAPLGVDDSANVVRGYFFPEDVPDGAALDESGASGFKEVPMPRLDVNLRGSKGWAFAATPQMGVRRAPGRLQLALGRMVAAQTELYQAVDGYDSLLLSIQDQVKLLEARYDLQASVIQIRNAELAATATLDAAITAATITARITRQIGDSTVYTAELLDNAANVNSQTTGTSNSAGSIPAQPVKQSIVGAAFVVSTAAFGTALTAEVLTDSLAAAKDSIPLKTQIEIDKANYAFDIQQALSGIEQQMRTEADLRVNIFLKQRGLEEAIGEVRSIQAEGERLMEERALQNAKIAGPVQQLRYQDIAFRNFRNDALQKYRASFDLAARYVYLAAKTYDYETCLPDRNNGAGANFLTSIVRQRALGQFLNGEPVNGVNGLSDPMARMKQNFAVLKGQLGFNNPQTETGRFSLRSEKFRLTEEDDQRWRETLQSFRVDDLWQIPEFRRYCRPFAPESAGPQPGLVIPFSTDVTFGQNFFGWPLAGGDSSYDSSNFATKIRSVGVWFDNYNGRGLSTTPRVYLVPAGLDIMRTPVGNDLATREFNVLDQALPVPFPLGTSDLNSTAWIPQNDSLNGPLFDQRRSSRFRAYHDGGFDMSQMTTDSRLIGRSVWNTNWVLIIPGGTFLANPNTGLDTFINGQLVPGSATLRDGNGIKDIKLFFQTYAYSGF